MIIFNPILNFYEHEQVTINCRTYLLTRDRLYTSAKYEEGLYVCSIDYTPFLLNKGHLRKKEIHIYVYIYNVKGLVDLIRLLS